jgi:hypothetical protein
MAVVQRLVNGISLYPKLLSDLPWIEPSPPTQLENLALPRRQVSEE